jgi:hypothetical protein
VQPLLNLAHEIVEEELDYSYTTAILMIFLCISRWNRNSWIDAMKRFIKDHLKKVNPTLIDLLFKANHDKLIMFIEWFADEMILQVAKFRNDKGLVCSETVAAIFNQTEPVGKYHIQKPLKLASNNSSSLLSVDINTSMKIVEFVNELVETKLKVQNKNQSNWREYANMIYTPHDIARSENTYLAGKLTV